MLPTCVTSYINARLTALAPVMPQIISHNRLVLRDAEVVEVVDDDGIGEDGLGLGQHICGVITDPGVIMRHSQETTQFATYPLHNIRAKIWSEVSR